MTDAATLLNKFVETLSEKELKKLAAKIELDRGENKFGLPHQAIMTLLRPRLAEIRAPRIYTAQRILCVPFEDMLIIKGPGYKQTGQILRQSIMPMWKLLTEELIPDRWAELDHAFLAAQKASDDKKRKQAASAIWRESSRYLLDWIAEQESDPERMKRAMKRLGGAQTFQDIKEMIYVLEIADILESAKENLPRKPIIMFRERHIDMLKFHYDKVAEEFADHELYFLLALMGRLLQPFPILKILRVVSGKLDDRLASRTDISIVGNLVIEALEEDAGEVVRVASDRTSKDEDLMARTRRFADAFRGITKDMGIRRDGEWGKRMYHCRSRVADAVERTILSDARKTVLLVCPKKGKNRAIADFSNRPDEGAFDRSDRRAQALGEAMSISNEIGLQSATLTVITGIRKELDNYAATIISELPRITDDQRANARAHLATAVRLVELISNSDEADLLRRRGNAALNRSMVS